MRYYAVLFSGDISTIIRNIAIHERHRANFYVIPDPVGEANNTRVRPDIDVITNDEAGSFFIAVFLANGCVLANDEVFANLNRVVYHDASMMGDHQSFTDRGTQTDFTAKFLKDPDVELFSGFLLNFSAINVHLISQSPPKQKVSVSLFFFA
ncbi:hypothetical protein FHC77_11960 [Atlantibacter hermannii]|nr:hypothetical protein [Atlantibacter hermannii]